MIQFIGLTKSQAIELAEEMVKVWKKKVEELKNVTKEQMVSDRTKDIE